MEPDDHPEAPAIPSREAAGARRSRAALAADRGHVYWLESRPEEQGRGVLVEWDPESATRRDASPPDVSIRSRAHGYGGGAVRVDGGRVVYSDQADQRLHRFDLDASGRPVPITPEAPPGVRIAYADGRFVPGTDWFVTVEDREEGGRNLHRIVAVDAAGRHDPVVLVDGPGFVAAPRPDGRGHLVWVAWEDPWMSWDSSTLHVAELAVSGGEVALGAARLVAGGPGIAVGQPRWCADGTLVAVDDASGWWRPVAFGPAPGWQRRELEVGPGEYHRPDWVFGQSTLAEVEPGILLARCRRDGADTVERIALGGGPPVTVEQPCVAVEELAALGGVLYLLGAPAEGPSGVFAVRPGHGARRISDPPGGGRRRRPPVRDIVTVAAGDHTVPVHLVRPAAAGPPPPLLVWCHGGPTAAFEPGDDPLARFFVERGVAVAGVDYRGSVGYGRAYREALRGGWGVADVEDCVRAAEALADRGLVDPRRWAIRGTSAGGLTALSALSVTDRFRCAVAWYGVTDLERLAATTHAFEAHYLDGLVGPLPGAIGEYRRRSPGRRVDAISGRVLLLQGTDDEVVPPAQAEAMRDALDRRGVRCDLVWFEGEGHGFRLASSIEAALEAELACYREALELGATAS